MKFVFLGLIFLSFSLLAQEVTFERVHSNAESNQDFLMMKMKNDVKRYFLGLIEEEVAKNPSKRKQIVKKYAAKYKAVIDSINKGGLNSGDNKNEKRWPTPGLTAAVPSGFSGAWGSYFIGAGYQPWQRNFDTQDGSALAGFGYGNGWESFGGSIVFTGDSIYDDKDRKEDGDKFKFKIPKFDRGGVTASIGKNFSKHLIGVKVGMDHIVKWGYETEFSKSFRSKYLSVSKLIVKDDKKSYFLSHMQFTCGVGTRAYQHVDDFVANKKGFGFFVGAGFRILKWMSWALDYKSEEFSTAFNFTPLKNYPLSVGLSFSNILGTDQKNDPPPTLQLSYSFSFLDQQ